MIGGAVPHFVKDMESCICYLEANHPIGPDDLLRIPISWVGNRSPKTGINWSLAIKGFKTGDPTLIKVHLRALLLMSVKRAIGERLYVTLHNIYMEAKWVSNVWNRRSYSHASWPGQD
jgi:hypothetical protein